MLYRFFFVLSTTSLVSLITATSAFAAVGDELAKFKPPKSGDGRGIEMKSGTTAYYSTIASENKLYLMNLKTQADGGSLDTNLNQLQPGRTFGALTANPTNGQLFGVDYAATAGRVYRIDQNGGLTQLFDARNTDLALSGVDGLAADTDGSLYVSGDGLGIATTSIYHFSAAGAQIGTAFTVPFGNSGMAIDGDDLWLANIDGKRIYKYTKAGAAAGVSFPINAEINAEDLTVDKCSFTGKKALWVVSASTGGGGSVAAYEIGASDNAGCPADSTTPTPAPGTPKITDPGAPSQIVVTKPKRGFSASRPIRFKVPSTLDSAGTIFTYLWIWDDYVNFDIRKPVNKLLVRRDPVQEKAETTHKFECAGYYKPTVKMLDAFGNTKEIPVSKKIGVNFPASTVARHGSLEVSPLVSGSGGSALIRADARKRKRRGRTKVRKIAYKLDGKKIGTRKKPGQAVRAKAAAGPHILDMSINFKRPRGKKRIKTCFQLTGS